MEGWISLHRKMLDNPIVSKDSDYLAVWIYLLLNATHTEYTSLFKGNTYILQPGQLITGRKSIAKKLNINETKVQRILKCYENEHQIEQQTSSQNRLITILNWNKYQHPEHRIEQRVNNERTTSEQRVNTNNNVITNNDNNIYLYLFNKYKKDIDKNNFSEWMKANRKLKEDESFYKLSEDEQDRLFNY